MRAKKKKKERICCHPKLKIKVAALNYISRLGNVIGFRALNTGKVG